MYRTSSPLAMSESGSLQDLYKVSPLIIPIPIRNHLIWKKTSQEWDSRWINDNATLIAIDKLMISDPPPTAELCSQAGNSIIDSTGITLAAIKKLTVIDK